MVRTRVIPVLFLMNGSIVRSETFSQYKIIGNPYSELARYSEWRADELVYVDITRDTFTSGHRTDHKVKVDSTLIGILREIAKHALMPLTFGGRIFTLEQADEIIENGADKVLINTGAYRNPQLVTDLAETHGSQATVVGIDIWRDDGRLQMKIDQGRHPVDDDPVAYAKRMESLGAGELLVNSIDRDGTGAGYDLDAIAAIAGATTIPVVACGGCGTLEHFAKPVQAGASAVAAGNIFHFTENAYPRAKRALRRKEVNVR